QEKYTNVQPELVAQIAREFAQNAIDSKGRSMIIMGSGINHWYHSDTIYRAILNLVLMTDSQGVNSGGWAHYVGQEKVRPYEELHRKLRQFDDHNGLRHQPLVSFGHDLPFHLESCAPDRLPGCERRGMGPLCRPGESASV